MNKLTLNLETVQNGDEFHDQVMNALGFPPYYGRNRDAFWDCLSDFIEPTEVTILGFNNLNFQLLRFIADYLSMMLDYQVETNGEFSVILE